MKVFARSLGFSLTPALAAYTHARVTDALAHRQADLRRVDVHLGDINGPRGGADKECRVVARFVGGRTLTVRQRDADLYRAVHDAAAVVGRRADERAARKRGERRGAAR